MSTYNDVLELVSSLLGVSYSELSQDTEIKEQLNMTSLQIVAFFFSCEEKFGVSTDIFVKEFSRLKTIRNIVELIDLR